jgi:hypothetical protein
MYLISLLFNAEAKLLYSLKNRVYLSCLTSFPYLFTWLSLTTTWHTYDVLRLLPTLTN